MSPTRNRAPLGAGDLDLRVARGAAVAARRLIAPDACALNLNECCAAVRAEVHEADLGALSGGLQGMLVPLADNRFRIAVDPQPAGGWGSLAEPLREALRQQRARFRIAHELGHTHFYRRSAGRRPMRAFPGGSAEEEAFCDEYARYLLIPPAAGPSTATEVLGRQKRYDVSLEIAARAAAASDASPAVALWRWNDGAEPGRPALHLQWSTDSRLSQAAGIVQLRTAPHELEQLFAGARRRLGAGFSAVILPSRRQALAILT